MDNQDNKVPVKKNYTARHNNSINRKQKRRSENKYYMAKGFSRLFIAFLLLCVQLGVSIYLYFFVKHYFAYINIVLEIIAVLVSIYVSSTKRNPSTKLLWIMVILIAPILGLSLYVLFGMDKATYRLKKGFVNATKTLRGAKANELSKHQPTTKNQINNYLYQKGYGSYHINDLKYYADASSAYSDMLNDMEHAQKFIFLEYHAIELGESFEWMKSILHQKAKEGVTIKIIYDDIGSMFFMNKSFKREMAEWGIEVQSFNPLSPFFQIFMNNRDHRKMTIIDGKIAYTGGYNIANEYFNITHPYGEWKDTGIRFTGSAVNSMTLIFLEMWLSQKGVKPLKADDYLNYYYTNDGTKLIIPYADSPLDLDLVGENVYIDMINNANQYVYISTPYLALSDELLHALKFASERGIDVHIITPGIPDKKIVYKLTRTYYKELIPSGVHIHEYIPGFNHAKMCLTDKALVIGTINFDYRSLFLHFENGVYIEDSTIQAEVYRDFQEMLSNSRLCDQDKKYRNIKKYDLGDTLIRLFAHLL